MSSSTHAVDYVKALYGEPSPFPPSFDGSPWSYAFGLFGDIIAAALALTVLLSFLLEGRRARLVQAKVDNWVINPEIDRWTPLWLYRMGQQCFLSFVVMRTLPDTVWMLAWGEVEVKTIELMLRIDLLADGFSVIPMFLAIMCWAWGRQVIPQRLAEGLKGKKIDGHPPWDVVFKNARIVAVVSVIALLVTIGKASG